MDCIHVIDEPGPCRQPRATLEEVLSASSISLPGQSCAQLQRQHETFKDRLIVNISLTSSKSFNVSKEPWFVTHEKEKRVRCTKKHGSCRCRSALEVPGRKCSRQRHPRTAYGVARHRSFGRVPGCERGAHSIGLSRQRIFTPVVGGQGTRRRAGSSLKAARFSACLTCA